MAELLAVSPFNAAARLSAAEIAEACATATVSAATESAEAAPLSTARISRSLLSTEER